MQPSASSCVSPVFLQCGSSELLCDDWAHNGLVVELYFIKSLKGITKGVPIEVPSSLNASNSRRRSILIPS